MATGSNVRVGDADRDAAAAQLREHYTAGRLTLDELNERLGQAFSAKTRGDLNAVTRDLPYIATPTAATPNLSATGSQSGWGGHSAGSGRGTGPRSGMRAGLAYLIPAIVAVWGLLVLGSLFAFGFGGGRPLGIIFFLAALALIRRMFGRRRRYARRGGRCGRRW
jgi:hypothetical protein